MNRSWDAWNRYCVMVWQWRQPGQSFMLQMRVILIYPDGAMAPPDHYIPPDEVPLASLRKGAGGVVTQVMEGDAGIVGDQAGASIGRRLIEIGFFENRQRLFGPLHQATQPGFEKFHIRGRGFKLQRVHAGRHAVLQRQIEAA